LVCSLREEPEVRWFGWENGSVVALETTKEQQSTALVIGEKPCQHK
jgi:hypothetical protein